MGSCRWQRLRRRLAWRWQAAASLAWDDDDIVEVAR
jgi:hypothetical protein